MLTTLQLWRAIFGAYLFPPRHQDRPQAQLQPLQRAFVPDVCFPVHGCYSHRICRISSSDPAIDGAYSARSSQEGSCNFDDGSDLCLRYLQQSLYEPGKRRLSLERSHKLWLTFEQYFLWYMVFLPIYLPGSTFLKSPKLGATALGLWIVSQAAWLQQGFNLEFLGVTTFFPGLFASSVGFFLVNCWILGIMVSDGDSTTIRTGVKAKQ